LLAAAGSLAGGVAAQLCAPLREIRDSLAVMIETLDRHLVEARGPEPFPWAQTKELRERIAEAYLLGRAVTRLTGDLARAVSLQRGAPETADVNQLVEQAVSLARHRVGEETELSIDLGVLPAVRLVPGGLVLILARLLVLAADGGRSAPGACVAIATRRERDAASARDQVVVEIAGRAEVADEDAAELEALARRVLEPAGGQLARRGPGQFEIRLAAVR